MVSSVISSLQKSLMNPDLIRSAYTDFLGNFFESLYSIIDRYDKFEKNVETGFNTHDFKPEIKERFRRF